MRKPKYDPEHTPMENLMDAMNYWLSRAKHRKYSKQEMEVLAKEKKRKIRLLRHMLKKRSAP